MEREAVLGGDQVVEPVLAEEVVVEAAEVGAPFVLEAEKDAQPGGGELLRRRADGPAVVLQQADVHADSGPDAVRPRGVVGESKGVKARGERGAAVVRRVAFRMAAPPGVRMPVRCESARGRPLLHRHCPPFPAPTLLKGLPLRYRSGDISSSNTRQTWAMETPLFWWLVSS